MSALQEFVIQQKAKSSNSGGLFSLSGFSELKTKFSSATGLQYFTRVGQDSDADTERLTDISVDRGQLPAEKNRKVDWTDLGGDDGMCGLSRTQRILAFFMSFLAAVFCFGMAILLIPVLVLKARQFAALNSLGSVLMLMSFGFLWGPASYIKHTLSDQKRYITLLYVSTVVVTLYSSLWLQSSVLTIIFAAVQSVSLLWYVVSYAPGGERGLRYMSRMFRRLLFSKSTTTLPI